jgi:hypothetical protein
MPLKVLSSPGVISLVSVVSFRPSATEPDVPDPVRGLEVVIPVMVPPPVPVIGKVCPGAQLMTPAGEMERPVAARGANPAPYSNARFDDGVLVLLPVGTTCQAKF